MSLSIIYSHRPSSGSILLTPAKPICPGSEILGTIQYDTPQPSTIDRVTITLSGRCEVKIREHLHYTTRTFRSRGYLFYITQEVFVGGGFTHKAGHYDWPFQINVPQLAHAQWKIESPGPGRPKRVLDHNGMMKVESSEDQDARGGKYDYFPARPPWMGTKDTRGHLLPDSFEVKETEWPFDWEAGVEYALVARVEKSSGGSRLFGAMISKGRELEETLSLRMQNPLDISGTKLLRAKPQLLSFQRNINEERRPWLNRAITKMSKTVAVQVGPKADKAMEQSDNGYKMHFAIEVATAIEVGSKFRLPFRIKARVSNDVSRGINPPSVIIGEVRAVLLRKTSVRDDGLSATEHTATQVSKVVAFQRKDMREQLKFCSSDGVPGVATEQPPQYNDRKSENTANSGDGDAIEAQYDMTDLLRLPDSAVLTPTFSTYNVAVEYILDFEIKLHVSDTATILLKSSESQGGNPKIVVLPAAPSASVLAGDHQSTNPEAGTPSAHSSKEAEAEHEANLARKRESEEEVLPAYEP